MTGCFVVVMKREVNCLASELIAGLWKMDMMAIMRAVAITRRAVFEDFASRLMILGGMVGLFNNARDN